MYDYQSVKKYFYAHILEIDFVKGLGNTVSGVLHSILKSKTTLHHVV